MSPIKKRARIRAEEQKKEIDNHDATSDIQTTIAGLLNEVEKYKGDEKSTFQLKSTLLQLKSLQRQLYSKLNIQKLQLDNAACINEKRTRDEAARQYERSYLEAEINKCKSFQMVNLEKIAMDEIEVNVDAPDVSKDESITRFLNNANVSNPQEKNDILITLHQHLEGRGILENQLKRKQEELNQLTRQLQVKRDFLNSLPGHLQTIERASQPLIKFMSKSNNPHINHKMIGKDRLLRLETAQSLAPPLYTIFTLLQHYKDKIDLTHSNDDQVSLEKNDTLHSKISLKVIASEKKKDNVHQQQILLQLPVPDYSSSSSIAATTNKRVSIIFRYYPQFSIVTVQANGCGTTLNQDILLDELFPGDTTTSAESLLAAKIEMLKQRNDNDIDNSKVIQPTGTPYQWCNVLAGLYQVPTTAVLNDQKEKQTVLVHSTRVVMSELVRRIRVNALLKNLLQSLKRNQIPTPPIESPNDDSRLVAESKWKLVNFAVSKNNDYVDVKTDCNLNNEVTYQVTLQKETELVQAEVQLHMSRYPAVPPKWSIILKEEDGMHPLYDARIASLEQNVNIGILERSNDINTIERSSESFCEWILIYQILEIMRHWDDWVEQNISNQNTENSSIRKVKGRDHSRING